MSIITTVKVQHCANGDNMNKKAFQLDAYCPLAPNIFDSKHQDVRTSGGGCGCSQMIKCEQVLSLDHQMSLPGVFLHIVVLGKGRASTAWSKTSIVITWDPLLWTE